MAQLNEKQLELAKAISSECKTPSDVTALLKNLFAGALEQMMEAEIEEHLGYEKHSPAGDHSGNSRNGFNKKTLKSEWGEAEISVPRDRNGTFEPKVVEKLTHGRSGIKGIGDVWQGHEYPRNRGICPRYIRSRYIAGISVKDN